MSTVVHFGRPAVLGIALILFIASAWPSVHSQTKTENVIIVTLDGFRWQEVFGGMDSAIAHQKRFHRGDSAYIFKQYWSVDPESRRELLMPFLWSTMANEGQLHGNRHLGSNVDVANPYWFSYPGYNEIFTGYPDTAVNSNSYPNNPHTNILEFLNRQPRFAGKVAAFGAWDAFSRILNAPRAGFPLIAAFDDCGGPAPTTNEVLINRIRNDSYRPWGSDECFDVFTYYAALEDLKTRAPRVLYIGFGETDEWAHAEDYRAYLDAAHQCDAWLRDLWALVQSDPVYRERTALFVTADHGRGDREKEQWTGHGQSVPDSHEIWFGIIGPDIRPAGEIAAGSQTYASQFAQTIASLLGCTFVAEHPVGKRMESVFGR
jgi:hypothetical protein